MLNIGWGEALVLLAIALIIFGPSRLPEMGKALGRTIREFKKATAGQDTDEAKAKEDEKSARAGEASS